MRKIIVAFFTFATFAAGAVGSEMPTRDCRDAVSQYLLDAAGRSAPGEETGAFLIRSENGEVKCKLWPKEKREVVQRQVHFHGSPPVGTIGIMHTHPSLPHLRLPSQKDAEAAKRLSLPIFVVTRFELWVVYPDGKREELPRPQRSAEKEQACPCSDLDE